MLLIIRLSHADDEWHVNNTNNDIASHAGVRNWAGSCTMVVVRLTTIAMMMVVSVRMIHRPLRRGRRHIFCPVAGARGAGPYLPPRATWRFGLYNHGREDWRDWGHGGCDENGDHDGDCGTLLAMMMLVVVMMKTMRCVFMIATMMMGMTTTSRQSGR